MCTLKKKRHACKYKVLEKKHKRQKNAFCKICDNTLVEHVYKNSSFHGSQSQAYMANTEGHHSFSGAKLEEISWKALTIWTTISVFQDGNLTDIFVRASIKNSRKFFFK